VPIRRSSPWALTKSKIASGNWYLGLFHASVMMSAQRSIGEFEPPDSSIRNGRNRSVEHAADGRAAGAVEGVGVAVAGQGPGLTQHLPGAEAVADLDVQCRAAVERNPEPDVVARARIALELCAEVHLDLVVGVHAAVELGPEADEHEADVVGGAEAASLPVPTLDVGDAPAVGVRAVDLAVAVVVDAVLAQRLVTARVVEVDEAVAVVVDGVAAASRVRDSVLSPGGCALTVRDSRGDEENCEGDPQHSTKAHVPLPLKVGSDGL
jgi:hypothetical protein